MQLWATVHKKHRVIAKSKATSSLEDVSDALVECMEQVLKDLDISEPVWVGKHVRELARCRRTKFFPSDFIEPVHFDALEIEFSLEDTDR